jgi:RNA polymerase sigma factor for flagellar operon FliA
MWQQYAAAPTLQLRNALAVVYIPLVQTIAGMIHARIPHSVSRDELESAGHIGLLAAVQRFEPGKDVRPETYIGHRVRGAMFDELRSLDPLPRSVRQVLKRHAELDASFEQRYGRRPTLSEAADLMSMPAGRLASHLDIATARPTLTIHHTGPDTALEGPEAPLSRETDPSDAAATNDSKEWVTELLRRPNQRRAVVGLYYDGRSAADLAQEAGLTNGAIGHARRDALAFLRRHFGTYETAEATLVA